MENKQTNNIEINNTELPTKVLYRRMWEYGADYECEDIEIIKNLVSALENIKVGPEVNYQILDFTDIIVLYYADGSEKVYEFEEYNIVLEGKRYVVDGLQQVRTILEEIASK